MAVNLSAFAAAGAFWQYLESGQWWHTTLDAYKHNVLAALDALVYPLGVVHHRWMVLVYGLLLATLIYIPLMMAVAYRLRMALPFVVLLAVVAQSPVLALSTGLGCLLIGPSRLRNQAPMLACMLGVLPTVALLGALDVIGILFPSIKAVPPLQRWLVYMPLVVAVAASMVTFSLTLSLARLAKYRPGVIAPVLLLIAAAAVTVFYDRVGPDELDYALITRPTPQRHLKPGDTLFNEMTLEAFVRTHDAHGLERESLRRRVQDDLDRQRTRLLAHCQGFLDAHNLSPRAPSIAWLAAQCRSLTLDEPAFAAGVIRYTAAFVQPESQPNWQMLVTRYERSPHASLARLRLAELMLRDMDDESRPANYPGQFLEAYSLLTDAETHLTEFVSTRAGRSLPSQPAELFTEPVAFPSGNYYAIALHRVRLLIWLMNSNKVLTDKLAAEAFAEWLGTDPLRPDRPGHYRELAQRERFAGSPFEDNLRLAAILAEPDRLVRIEQLLPLADQPLSIDTAIQANYELARLVAQPMDQPLPEGVDAADVYFQRVLDAEPSPWQDRAAQRLARLGPRDPN